MSDEERVVSRGITLEAFPHSIMVKEGEELAKQGREAVEWLRGLGVSTPADRYHGYLRTLESSGRIPKSDSVTKSAADGLVNANTELYELIRVRKALLEVDSDSYLTTLKHISQGQAFRHIAEKDPGRDYLFEMSMAARLLRAGHEVDLNQIADIVAQVNGRKIYIEAKRIKSPTKLAARVSEANKQLQKRLTQTLSNTARGIVAVNITDILEPHGESGFVQSGCTIQKLHSNMLNDYAKDNLEAFDNGAYLKCLGVFIESTWQGWVWDGKSDPSIFCCRGAIFRRYQVNQTDKDYVRDFLPELANQFG
jgi:hypothetical protein